MMAWFLTLVVVAALALWLLKRWHWRRQLARGLPPVALGWLEQHVAQYAAMDAQHQQQLGRLVQHFLRQKTFVGCAGQVVTDEMRVTIAGHACLLVLGRLGGQADPTVFPGLEKILVYPGAFGARRNEVDAAGVVTATRQDMLGESWGDGRVILAWDHVRRAGRVPAAGHNIVLHEFAHQLDTESGSANGAPDLGSRERYRRWSQVLARHFEQLRHEAEWGGQGVIDHYGASSPAEFFAVVTEAFFEQPHQLAARHPELYAEFSRYYALDPSAWQAAPEPSDPEEPLHFGAVYGQWR